MYFLYSEEIHFSSIRIYILVIFIRQNIMTLIISTFSFFLTMQLFILSNF